MGHVITYIAFTKISIHTSKLIKKMVKKLTQATHIIKTTCFHFQRLISSPYYIKVKNPLALRGITKGVLKLFETKGTYELRNKPRQLLKMHSFKILTTHCTNALQQEQSWAITSTSKEKHDSICNILH